MVACIYVPRLHGQQHIHELVGGYATRHAGVVRVVRSGIHTACGCLAAVEYICTYVWGMAGGARHARTIACSIAC